MKVCSVLVIIFMFFNANGQTKVDSLSVDENFLEDQFYLGITYNFLVNQPNDVSQRNLSYGLQAGVIKDIPLSKDRKVALGVGLGYALNTYYSNLKATEGASGISYSVLGGDDDYTRNKLESHLIEMPLEFRWRNATVDNYKFWRIYTGFKLGYVFSTRSKIVSDLGDASFYNTDSQKFVYGLTFSLGYNTFNLHAYYGFNDLFKDGVSVNGEAIVVKPLRIGLIFYIL